ncbi:hypothetical protein A9C11_19320 [Pseudomonas citronellolis]|uniref:Uncharacterized protein n=1 Tax=Pseudomonas citronellolis TaxID=53408 RepID=A0A1A9KEY4_9PSED|nr:hypothetical protein [Pseudomonas citronellolis]ANI15991.1 hypothetical protein A9C11_19320 [Pseudomonas citronellolis]
MNDVGQAISSGFKFVSQVGEECEALANVLKQELDDLFVHGPLKDMYRLENWSSSYNTKGWIYSDMAWSLPLVPKRRGKPKVAAHLSFQISLLCSDPEAGSSPEPLLHINFWEPSVSFRNDEFMGFPMTSLSCELQPRLRDGTARLLRWDADDHDGWWTYTLRLAEVRSLEDVRKLISVPVGQLLGNTTAGEAMLETLSAVVCYKAVDDQPDYYRVIF